MEKETSSLIALGVILIALAALIGISIGVFGVGKSLANKGENNVISAYDSAEKSKWDEYDSTVITGLVAKNSIKDLINNGNVVLLHTNALDTEEGY